MNRLLAVCATTCLALGAPAAAAQDETGVQIHGFVSQGYIKTTRNNYLGPSARKQGHFEFSEVGINVTKQITDKLRVGAQLFAHDLGPLGNYAPQFDWYYLDYRFFDWFGIRAGRTKLPFGLYNEANDIDAGRVPVLLPQSIYPVASREILFAQTGAEVYGDVSLGDAGSLEYRAYGGTIYVNTADASPQLRGFEVPYVVGARAMWSPRIEGLRLGGSVQAVRLDLKYAASPEETAFYQAQGQLPPDFNGIVTLELPVRLWVASVEYQRQGLMLAAEVGRNHYRTKLSLLVPDTLMTSQGLYLMGSYQVAPWFTPGLYYSLLLPNVREEIDKRSTYQHDVAMTLRYDLTPNWLLKLEGHYMSGTAGLTSALNDNRKLDELSKNWGVFLVKTTGYF